MRLHLKLGNGLVLTMFDLRLKSRTYFSVRFEEFYDFTQATERTNPNGRRNKWKFRRFTFENLL